ncbi:MAG: hypothetical protein WD690_13955 [Vicinamibacterales bacterium]
MIAVNPPRAFDALDTHGEGGVHRVERIEWAAHADIARSPGQGAGLSDQRPANVSRLCQFLAGRQARQKGIEPRLCLGGLPLIVLHLLRVRGGVGLFGCVGFLGFSLPERKVEDREALGERLYRGVEVRPPECGPVVVHGIERQPITGSRRLVVLLPQRRELPPNLCGGHTLGPPK